MIFYLSLAFVFWLFVLVTEYRKDLYPLLAGIVILAFVGLAGLRWETGYDWIAYEQAVAAAPTLLRLSFFHLPDALKPMEPLFVILLSTIKTFGGTIQTLYFIVALFNGITFYVFVRYCRANVIFSFAIYFCWVYLLVQMGIARQSIALSFIMLALIRFDKSTYFSTLVLFLIGVCFQYSSVMLAPIFLTFGYKKIIEFKIPILLGLAAFFFSGFGLFDALGKITEHIHFSFIAKKLQDYQSIGPAPKSLGATVYFLVNIFTFFYFSKIVDVNSRLEKSLMLSLLLMIIVEAVFWQFPLLWNRTQYFVVVAQGILLYKTWETIGPLHKTIQIAVVFALSIAALIKPLLNESARPYLPYQSSMRFIYTTDSGDGRKRLEDYNVMIDKKVCPKSRCHPAIRYQ
ncbi:putative membrane protein [Collimonas fungivorans]|uniref:Putative membrane protein n=1 Tax=Collimonas fungivorans TaxID=158899 RepID=A0A127PGZ2_9BURK|nr:EpsG family protein [Collimonas fungivorans]AMO96995.1 putative membrane protein [Collimonas fungivorans]